MKSLLAACFFAVSPLTGQIAITSAGAAGAQTAIDATFVEDFDSLASAESSGSWEDNANLPGWYSFGSSWSKGGWIWSSGLNLSPRIYGSPGSADQALGLNEGGGFALRFVNGSDFSITGLEVAFDGEQWERGASDPQRSDTLMFQYQVFDAGAGDIWAAAGWTTVEELSFTSPDAALASYASLDGNAAVNRVADVSHFITGLVVGPGQEIWLRWTDPDEPGAGHGLAIDNLRVSFTAVPEPAAVAAVFGVLALGLAVRRRHQHV